MSRRQLWIIAAAGLVFVLIFGVRQSVALFIGPIHSATGLGIAAISLAFTCAQLMWGITQPIAGAVADKYGTGRVVAAGADQTTRGPSGIGSRACLATMTGPYERANSARPRRSPTS